MRWYVSIHAFREGRRLGSILCCVRREGFNPRLPRGKATSKVRGSTRLRRFNPRLPRGKATIDFITNLKFPIVSIHAFREGRRHVLFLILLRVVLFQSTPSAREGDLILFHVSRASRCFNPRLPRGKATTRIVITIITITSFNPRLPRGKATYSSLSPIHIIPVSIHAFREGRRRPQPIYAHQPRCFNPRLPRGKATYEK